MEFEQVAAAVIAQAGYDYPVRVELEDTQFPTKEYDGFTLPAGEYLALRVLIGEAKGPELVVCGIPAALYNGQRGSACLCAGGGAL